MVHLWIPPFPFCSIRVLKPTIISSILLLLFINCNKLSLLFYVLTIQCNSKHSNETQKPRQATLIYILFIQLSPFIVLCKTMEKRSQRLPCHVPVTKLSSESCMRTYASCRTEHIWPYIIYYIICTLLCNKNRTTPMTKTSRDCIQITLAKCGWVHA